MSNRTKDGWARWSYEQLLLRQPHIETEGLWQVGHMFVVHCPKLRDGLLADDKRPIEKWFADNKAITTPIGLAAEIPPGAERVETRSLRELVATAAAPRTLRELLLDLALLLPHEFPRHWLTDDAGRIVADARRRMPLLYPPLDAQQRHLVLREMVRATAALQNPTLRNVVEGIIGELKRFWSSAENLLHYRGASAILGIGIGPLAAVLYERLRGENLFREFSSAGRIVEWGAALNASLFPIHTEDFSAEGHSSILATIYSGVPNDPSLQRIGEAETILNGILCVDNDAPVVEFASSFKGGDIDRLRELVRKLKEDGPHPDLLADSIRNFNKQVKSYEQNSDKLGRLKITGPLGTIAAVLLPVDVPSKLSIGLGGWFIEQLFFGPITSSNRIVGTLLDGLRGSVTGNPANAVLVSRWRKSLKNLG